jgi:acyl-CoA synthetase (NDP forming)
VGYISQSGGNARKLVDLGGIRGIRFSRVVSYGNACDLDESDFLEYLTKDPQTEIIAAYVEGVRDGQRFLQALTEAAKTKPVIMLKGGRTKAGTRAVASHTGAIAGSEEIWAALFRQTGVLRVYDLDELTDLILAFLHLTPGAGRNVGLITLGGGAAVQAADDCEVAGLSVLPFPPQVLEELRRFTPAAGTSIRNPVDSMMIRPQMFAETTRVVASCPQIDLLINLLEVDTVLRFFGGRERLGEMVDTLIEARKEWRKPIVAIFHTAGSPQAAQAVIEEQEKCFRAGIPSYPSIGRASRAISRFIQYHQDRGSND